MSLTGKTAEVIAAHCWTPLTMSTGVEVAPDQSVGDAELVFQTSNRNESMLVGSSTSKNMCQVVPLSKT